MYRNDSENLKKNLTRLISFQFLFKFVPGSPSIPEKYFADFCKNKIDKNQLFKSLHSLCKDKELDFNEKFSDTVKYAPGSTIALQFVLERYMYYYGPGKKFAMPTIEHIIPQDSSDEIYNSFSLPESSYKLVHKIGNLTILEQEENGSRDKFNQEFCLKYPLYSKHLFKANKLITKYKFDTDPEQAILNRGAKMSSEIYHIFLKALETGKWPSNQ